MSDYYDGGHDGGDVHYADYEAGEQHQALDQLHQEHASESDYKSDFAVYEQDHEAAESTDFQQAQHVEYEDPHGARYEESNYVDYSKDTYEKDHVFAAEGSESAHEEKYEELDALKARFDSAFVEGTEYHKDGGYEIAAK